MQRAYYGKLNGRHDTLPVGEVPSCLGLERPPPCLVLPDPAGQPAAAAAAAAVFGTTAATLTTAAAVQQSPTPTH